MRRSSVAVRLSLLTLPLTAALCCRPEVPPRELITAAAFTQTSTWYLSEHTTAGQTTKADAIKDRFALRFAPDSSYRRILLRDSSETAGTWKLTGPDNRQLHLIDYKGDPQDFVVEAASPDALFLYRPDTNNQPGTYLFKTVR